MEEARPDGEWKKRPRGQSREHIREDPSRKCQRALTSSAPACAPGRAIGFPCRHVVGPMVGASDLAFRLLCRRHGADACYTEMLFSERLISDPAYRARKLQSCATDRPLVVQIQGSSARSVAAAAAAIIANCACDAIDLNLGCPLPQARDQCFGAYLLERAHWPTVSAMVGAMAASIDVPVFCKIRLLESVAETIEFCDMLAAAGCSLIAVHGRRRPEADRHRGQRQREAADLDAIRRIAAAVSVPVLSNGNTERAADVLRNLRATGAHGVMAAEGTLINPVLFEQHAALVAAHEPAQAPPRMVSPTEGSSGLDDAGSGSVDAGSRSGSGDAGSGSSDEGRWHKGGAGIESRRRRGCRDECSDHATEAAQCSDHATEAALCSDHATEAAQCALPRDALAQVALEYLRLAEEFPPESLRVVCSHLMWMLGKSGKGHRCKFAWLGPYTHEQLRMALVGADSVQELELITRAVLL